MPHIVGRGRYARETYPEARRGGAGAGCVLQACSDYERSDVIALGTGSVFLLPRQQDVTDNPIRCDFAQWTPGSYLHVATAIGFNLVQAAAASGIVFIPAFAIAIDVGAGFQGAIRTQRTMGLFADQNNFPYVYTGVSTHEHILGPFDNVDSVALVAVSWSITLGAQVQTGIAAHGRVDEDKGNGVSLVCEELAAGCVTAAQPPELVAGPLNDPPFVVPA
jgi:hypothetical protein